MSSLSFHFGWSQTVLGLLAFLFVLVSKMLQRKTLIYFARASIGVSPVEKVYSCSFLSTWSLGCGIDLNGLALMIPSFSLLLLCE